MSALHSIGLAGIGGTLGFVELSNSGGTVASHYVAAVGSVLAGATGLVVGLTALLKVIRKGPTTMQSETAAPPDLALHRRARASAVHAILLLATVIGLGCQAGPATRILALREAYTSTLEAAVSARLAGLTSDAAYERLERRRLAASVILDSLESSLNTRYQPTTGQIDAAAQAVREMGAELK